MIGVIFFFSVVHEDGVKVGFCVFVGIFSGGTKDIRLILFLSTSTCAFILGLS